MRTQPATAAATLALACALVTGAAHATPFTETSPVGGALPAGVSAVGGIVVDLLGTNATRIVAQTSASSLFSGYPGVSDYPLLIGTQTGFSPAILAALGGGIAQAAFRFTLYDGDTQAGNFDFNANGLLVNGATLPLAAGIGGNWSAIATQQTSADGLTAVSSGFGFGDDTLDTGWFKVTDTSALGTIYAQLVATGALAFRMTDVTPGDQFLDFTQGIDAALLDVGTGPVVSLPTDGGSVPLPGSAALALLALGAAGWARRRSAGE